MAEGQIMHQNEKVLRVSELVRTNFLLSPHLMTLDITTPWIVAYRPIYETSQTGP